MTPQRFVIETQRRRTVRVTHYERDWNISIGIGGTDTTEKARAVAYLTIDQTHELVGVLIEALHGAEAAKRETAQ